MFKELAFYKKKKPPKLTLKVNNSFLGTLHQNSLVDGLIALQLVASRRAVPHKSLLTLEHQNGTVDQIKVKLGRIFDNIGRSKQMTRALRGQQLSIVGAERNGSFAVPDKLEERICGATVSSGLNSTTSR